MSNQQLKSALRATLRSRRKSLARAERTAADWRIRANVLKLQTFRRARTVAAYLAFDGEPSLRDLFNDRSTANKHFVVPVIHSGRMQFAPLRIGTRLRSNKLGIAQPGNRAREFTRNADIVFVPLVGFDAAGNRLGMGGGYYDRHFSYLRERKSYERPKLIGVAYEIQCVSTVPTDAWDIPLWGIVTDVCFRKFNPETRR